MVLGVGIGLWVLIGLVGGWVSDQRGQGPGPSLTEGGVVVEVDRVTDGDTIRVVVDGTTERLRIIGIDAPELRGDECLARESAAAVERLVRDGRVRITSDPTQDDRDRYGRLLRHVWVLDGRSVGFELVSAGLASEYTYDRAYAGVAAYRAAERRAQQEGRGIWGDVCEDAAASSAQPSSIEGSP